MFFIVNMLRVFARTRALQIVLWIVAGIGLLVVGVVLLVYGFEGLALPYTSTAGLFVPGMFAAGVLSASLKKAYGAYYGIYVVVMSIVYVVSKMFGAGLALASLLAVHVPSGLIIIFVPVIFALRGLHVLALTSIGGLLISIAGAALASLAAGSPLIPAELVLLIATPIIFLSALLITIGLMRCRKWMGE